MSFPLPFTYAMLVKKSKNISNDFVGISSATLMRRHLSTWVTKGFKGLVACSKCNCDSYDNELGFRVCFCFARGRVKFKCGVLVWVLPNENR